MEYHEPIGLQVIENLLFEKKPGTKKAELLRQADVIRSSAKDINSLLFGFVGNEKQLLESVRLQLIRTITLGITGFDAPMIRSGIEEAAVSLESIQTVLQPFFDMGSYEADSVVTYLHSAIHMLRSSPGFNEFDRMKFLTLHALPLQRHLGGLIKKLNLELNTSDGILNYDAPDIFSPDAIDLHSFPSRVNHRNEQMVRLGEKLFFERRLSGNNKISCASCHAPEKHFTDALVTSIAFDGLSHVSRNAPSLLYSGFQHQQFWDGRAKTLEDQILTVINDPKEMNGKQALMFLLQQPPDYLKLFEEAFPKTDGSLSITDKVAQSLAEFVRSLNPRNSRFDQYMTNGNPVLSPQEIHGFNLFMGKAQCATCHFAPLFNGLVPPLYNLSELEVLGTPKSDDFTRPQQDTDLGRFNVFPMDLLKKAFKTPTVRNVSATAPYMHNGSFATLQKVIEFYNKGGGSGLGLKVGNQTLSSIPLNLSKNEITDIISFLKTLEDSVTVDLPIKQNAPEAQINHSIK
jgi:cytochrome c peroxidase